MKMNEWYHWYYKYYNSPILISFSISNPLTTKPQLSVNRQSFENFLSDHEHLFLSYQTIQL